MARCRGFTTTCGPVQLGDAVNEIVAEAVVGSAQEAAEWLRANAVRRYPHSEFARLYPRSANDP